MARPKGKLFALLAIFLAIGIVTATGAFTSVQAERTITAQVDSDTSAILGLEPHSGNNGLDTGTLGQSDGYADIQDGTLQVNLGGYEDGSGEGNNLNYNATTDFDYVFNISNNGAQSFNYYITRNGQAAGANNAVVFYQGQAGGTNVTTATNEGAAGSLSPGSTHQISIRVDLTGIDSNDVAAGTDLLDSFTIHANSV